jgi:hypothetical protein
LHAPKFGFFQNKKDSSDAKWNCPLIKGGYLSVRV